MKAQMPEMGKVSSEIFDEIILPNLGKRRKEILVGPQHGLDTGIIDLGNGQVMASTTDPIFVVPPYGWERSGWFAVHILASDAVTSGLPPQYITMDLNLPLSMNREQFKELWEVMHHECEQIGMSIIAGHTGRYEGCDYPMIGGATVFCVGPKDKYLTPAMAQVGDAVIITKGAAIEASGLFGVTFPDKVEQEFGQQASREAQEIFWKMSVVKDAMTAVEVGVRENGITAMHDATECGIWGGLQELAQASNVGMSIDKDKIIVKDIVRKICDLFKIDPYTSISEGTLILTCTASKATEVVQRLADQDIESSIVGEILEKNKGLSYFENGKNYELVHPKVDPFWAAFGKAASQQPTE